MQVTSSTCSPARNRVTQSRKATPSHLQGVHHVGVQDPVVLAGRGVAGLVHPGGLDGGLVERHQLVDPAGVEAGQRGEELLGAVEGVVVAAEADAGRVQTGLDEQLGQAPLPRGSSPRSPASPGSPWWSPRSRR